MEDFSFHGRRHIKRDYYNKTFSNPYFNKSRSAGQKFNTKLYIEILTAIFLAYVIVYSSLFKVKEVEVIGADMIDPQEIKTIVEADINRLKLLVFPGRNLIFINKGRIKGAISSKYSLNKLEIDKAWQKITVKLEEKPAYLIANNGKSYFFLDASGTLTKEMTADDLNRYLGKFPHLTMNRELKVGDKPVSDRAVNYALGLDQAMRDAKIKVRGLESAEVDQLTVITEAGWKAYFNINVPLDRSMENLLLVLNKKLAGRKFEYVDLRFGDRVTFFPER